VNRHDPGTARALVTAIAVLVALSATFISRAEAADAAGDPQTWYWSEATMSAALRADYSYDPKIADPGDPWHYELQTVVCTGAGPFIGRSGPRYFQRFVCTLTYVATNPTIPNYVDTMAARVTGRTDHVEDQAPAAAEPARPANSPGHLLVGFRDWTRVDAVGGNPPELLVKPRAVLLLGPARVLADSPGIERIAWRTWGGPRAVGNGRTRTKVYDPWTPVRLVADHVRRCGDTTAYTRVTASFRIRSGRARTTRHTWSMPACPIRTR